MSTPEGLLDLTDGAAWETWLEVNHDSAPEAWLRIGKKGATGGRITISEALDGALCFGWIDAQRKGLDEVSYLQRYCPRRARSSWSRVNVDRVERLVAAGRMRAPGIAQVEAARADGRWDAAYESQRTAELPGDLAEAIAADPAARSAYDALGRSDRYALMLPVLKTTTPGSRTREIERVLRRLR